VALPGAVVQLAGGDYGDQLLSYQGERTSNRDVLMRPAPGAHPRVGSLSFGRDVGERGAQHLTIEGLTIDALTMWRVRDVTLRDITAKSFAVNGGADIRFLGGRFGGTRGRHNDIVEWKLGNEVEAPRRVVVDGALFHDMAMETPADHIACLEIGGGVDMVVRDSRFVRCTHFDLNASDYIKPLRGMLIENNWFGGTVARFGRSYYALSIRSGEDVVIRNNSSDQAWASPTQTDRVVRWKVVANAMPSSGQWRCDKRIAYSHNLWTDGARCGKSDRDGDPRFLDVKAADFRVRAGSATIDAGDRRDHPSHDIAGHRRPRGAGPDIGAWER
jgi:hypothetical protein